MVCESAAFALKGASSNSGRRLGGREKGFGQKHALRGHGGAPIHVILLFRAVWLVANDQYRHSGAVIEQCFSVVWYAGLDSNASTPFCRKLMRLKKLTGLHWQRTRRKAIVLQAIKKKKSNQA
jgi:hypothetical protein